MCTRSKSFDDANSAVIRAQEVRKIYRRLSSVSDYTARQRDREEIRRRLASGTDDDDVFQPKTHHPVKRHVSDCTQDGGMNLQLCYMNHTHAPSDKAEVTSDSATSASSSSSTVTHCCQSRYHNVTWAAVLAARSSSSSSSSSSVSSSFVSLPSPALVSPSPFESSSGSIHNNNNNDNNNNDDEEEEEDDDDDDDEFEGIPPFLRPRRNGKHRDHGTNTGTESSNPRTALSLGTPRTPQTPSTSSAETLAQRQRRFQQEATVALAQASVNARMQLEEDRRNKRKSAIVEDIEGSEELGDGRRLKIPRQLLQEMNFAQLQVLVNDLHTQIEGLNEELVHLLIEKDDLHMGQDSMLVDVQDLNSFAQRLSEANNNKISLGSNNNNSSLKKTTIVCSPSTTSAASRRQLWTRNPSAQRVSVTDTVNGN